MCRVTAAYEAGKCADGGKALVARLHRATAPILQMSKELQH